MKKLTLVYIDNLDMVGLDPVGLTQRVLVLTRSDMSAAIMTEIMRPLIPTGMIPRTSFGNAMLEHETGFWQIAKQTSGSTQPTSSG